MNPIAQKLIQIIKQKQSNIAVALDLIRASEILDLADKIGPKICLAKTHIDIIEDFTPEFTEKLSVLSKKHNFLIFEDRKFADIGNTVKMQYAQGIYKIIEWSDMVNCHIVPGEGIIEGLREIALFCGNDKALILLAQMSSQGNLATQDYAKKAVTMAKAYSDFVIGFIGNGSSPEALRELRSLCGDDFLIFAPGIKLGSFKDTLRQQYNTPESAVEAGADILIVGRGIYQAESPVEAVEEYRKRGWQDSGLSEK